MRNSMFKEVSMKEVMKEYAEVSLKAKEHEKAKWGSRESMENRFRLGISIIDWKRVKRWLDIGCGTGMFFVFAEEEGHLFEEISGIDITPEILSYAKKRSFRSTSKFIEASLEISGGLAGFDLVTLVGVLQQCGMSPENALASCIIKLKLGGQFFMTTKNVGWKEFESGNLIPDESHSWFDYGEVEKILHDLGVTIMNSGGFSPRENKIVPLEESHTFFIYGIRQI